jgi:hypothetical protein
MQTAMPVRDQVVSANVEFYREVAQKYDHYHLVWSAGAARPRRDPPGDVVSAVLRLLHFRSTVSPAAITPEQMIASVKEVLGAIRHGSFVATTDKRRVAVASGERGNHG